VAFWKYICHSLQDFFSAFILSSERKIKILHDFSMIQSHLAFIDEIPVLFCGVFRMVESLRQWFRFHGGYPGTGINNPGKYHPVVSLDNLVTWLSNPVGLDGCR